MFGIDGKFYEIVSAIADLVILNLLFVLCSLPIFTIGASTTALFGVTKKMADNREGYIVRTYFKLFKENFKILNKNFNYEKNSLLEINFVNARQTEDTNLNKYLNKKKSKGKIDMVMALVDALYLLQERELLNQNDFVVQVI